MSEKDSPPLFSDTGKLKVLIHTLSVVIKVCKYLPWIVLALAAVNFTLAVLDFTLWNNIAGGVFNSILAFGGFVFFGQLFRRQKMRRYEYRYTGKHLQRVKVAEEGRLAPRSKETEAT